MSVNRSDIDRLSLTKEAEVQMKSFFYNSTAKHNLAKPNQTLIHLSMLDFRFDMCVGGNKHTSG